MQLIYSSVGHNIGPLAADMVHPDCGLIVDVIAGAHFC